MAGPVHDTCLLLDLARELSTLGLAQITWVPRYVEDGPHQEVSIVREADGVDGFNNASFKEPIR